MTRTAPLPIAEILALANAIGVKIDTENMIGVRFVLCVDDAPRCDVEYVGRSKERRREAFSDSALENIKFTGEKRDE